MDRIGRRIGKGLVRQVEFFMISPPDSYFDRSNRAYKYEYGFPMAPDKDYYDVTRYFLNPARLLTRYKPKIHPITQPTMSDTPQPVAVKPEVTAKDLGFPNRTSKTVPTFSIELTNAQDRYYPMQTVTGMLNVEIGESIFINGLVLTFKCQIHTEWSVGDDDSVSDNEILLSEERQLEIARSMPVGYFQYPFTFTIPPTFNNLAIPSFFTGSSGYSVWTLNAELKKSTTFSFNAKATILVPVYTFWDTNMPIPMFSQPARMEKEKNVCCLCCKSGPITLQLEIPRYSYGPGDSVPFRFTITNHSSRPVTSEISFIQKTWYSAKSWGTTYTTFEEQIIQSRSKTQEHDKIPHGETFTWPQGESHFDIPSTAEASFITRILTYGYVLFAKVKIPKAIALRAELPFAVGSTRLHSAEGDVGIRQTMEFHPAFEGQRPRFFQEDGEQRFESAV